KERVIKYLMEDLLVPHDMIDTDVALSEFEEGAEGILDIVVNVKDKEDYYAPVMIVQCMDEDIVLEGEVVQKQVDFLEDVDNITMAGRLVLTNGDAMMYADWTGEEYNTEASLPTYDTMVEEFFKMEELANESEHNHSHEHECCGGKGHEPGHEHECCGGKGHGEGQQNGCGCHHE
ncbi:MAG: hypothetical protein RR192_03950, partial [Peptostreptococcaceae bacterium]